MTRPASRSAGSLIRFKLTRCGTLVRPQISRNRRVPEAGAPPSNVLMHAAMAIRERRYNPGGVTATMLMVPHAAAGGRWLARSGRVSRRGGLLVSAAGSAFAGLPLAMKGADAPCNEAIA
jgi:hypothetical protein